MTLQKARSLAARLRGKEELVVTIGIFAFGVYLLAGTRNIQTPVSFSQIGPRFFPYLVGTVLTGIGVWLTIQVLRGKTGKAEESDLVDVTQRTRWVSVVLVVATIIIHGILINLVGWVIACAFLFWGVAFATGSRHWLRDPIVSVVVAVVVYIAFTRVLAVSLPAGILEGVI